MSKSESEIKAALRAFSVSAKARKLVAAFEEATREVETTREKVDSYILPYFKSFGFRSSEDGSLIEDPDQLYLCDDEQRVQEFYSCSGKLHEDNGWDIPEGFCPALMARSKRVAAMNALAEAARVVLDLPEIWDVDKRENLAALISGLVRNS